MKYKLSVGALSLLALAALLFCLSWSRQQAETLAGRIAPEILRFHVLADSSSPRDQQLKMEVKDLVISLASRSLGSDAGKEQTIQWIQDNQDSIESLAQDYLRSQGCSDSVRVSLTREYFPTKAYGDMIFPCGTYDAAKITIGSGKGRNWWCVLYPPLCYIDSIHAIVPESSKHTLKTLISQEDYTALEQKKPRIQIKFRILELFK